jgi:hypothetical protein
MSRSWLLYLDDMIASAEKIGRLTSKQALLGEALALRHRVEGQAPESGKAG